ncbi:MAG: glucose-6-phosphate isomerase [Gammaproteobacteria bacterium]|nr:glucose-6-phosphate isomerase [Gammaproteobacteria bacterium]
MLESTQELSARLRRQAAALATRDIASLFAAEPERLQHFGKRAAGLTLDLSKQALDETALTLLVELATAGGLAAAIEAMFQGHIINHTEQRAVLHTALRAGPQGTAQVDGQRVAGDVEQVLTRMAELVAAVHDGRWTGHDGARITDVVNIGIGGSHLGPQLACDALRYQHTGHVRVHFLANVDGGEFERVVAPLDPASTLFLVTSKSFTTVETRLNAKSARAWLAARFPDPAAIARHFVAVSAAPARAVEFGIAADNVYPLWDWVGGRYSLWSAVGLPIAFAVGMAGFRDFLAGARALDEHFRHAPFEDNLPVLLALLAFWNSHCLDAESEAVVPYDDRLRYLPDYLQQLEMESNGKRVDREGHALAGHSAPITWGGLGTNAQHAFFQLLHQGTRRVPVDFILSLTHPAARREHHDMLVANCIAQAEGLMRGRLIESTDPLARHRDIPGNRASTLITMTALTPATLGALIALYEHKTYVLSVLMNINAFDQWGVELGKVLAGSILEEIAQGAVSSAHDPSTRAVLEAYLKAQEDSV